MVRAGQRTEGKPGATIDKMAATDQSGSEPRWYLIPVRILIVAFLLALLFFAVSLLLGILGLVITGLVRGIHPNMTVAYRRIAAPGAVIGATVGLVSAAVIEIRNYRQTKSLLQIERASR